MEIRALTLDVKDGFFLLGYEFWIVLFMVLVQLYAAEEEGLGIKTFWAMVFL